MTATTVTRRALEYVATGLLLVVPLVILQANFKHPERQNALDRGVLAVSAPLQRAMSWVIEGIGEAWSGYVWLVDVEEENSELRRENDRLRRELAERTRLASDALRLEQLVGLKARIPADTVGARVVAAGTNPFFRVVRITLDRGEREIKPGMPVLAPDGVVGRIQRIHGSYADVLLAVDPQSSIDVVMARTGGRGVLKGLGGESSYGCKIDYLERTEEVKEGDLVLTSGLGGIFPRDVPLGRIKKVTKAEYGLYQEVEVEPSVDFSRLSHVLVILAPPPPPDPSAKMKKSPEAAFGVKPQ
ncbi:MAG: rod shape-determining protein MreC [Deltaproteobacteria bacterium]|nr:rod shape-determining protein MreC [Deltaproteobacteria bacterium]